MLMVNSSAFPRIGLVAVLALSLSCDKVPVTGPRPAPALGAISNGTDSIVDVGGYTIGLPPSPRAFDTDDDSLEAAVGAQSGLAFVAFKSPTSARSLASNGERAAVPARVIRDAIVALGTVGVEVRAYYRSSAMAYVHLPAHTAAAIRKSAAVDFVEPAGSVPAAGLSFAPSASGVAPMTSTTVIRGAMAGQIVPWNVSFVQAPNAWGISTGASAKIMFLGFGLIPSPDLPTVPPGNCAGLPNSCNSPYENGTLEAGVALALNNTYGVVGISYGITPTDIWIWRTFTDDHLIDLNQEVSGLNYAATHGIKTVLIDVIHSAYSQGEANQVAAAWTAGVITTTPVGNVTSSQPLSPLYPPSLANVVGVAGVKADSSFALYPLTGCANLSNAGSNWGSLVTVAAPFWAYTTAYGGYADTKTAYGYCATGLSAAHVAAIVALLQDKNPTWTPSAIVQQVTSTASHPSSKDTYIGYGIPNAAKALGYLPPPPPPPLSVTIGGPTLVKPQVACTFWTNTAGGTPPYQYQWTVNGGDVVGTSDVFTYTNIGVGFTLAVHVTDAASGSASASLVVNISSGANDCTQ